MYSKTSEVNSSCEPESEDLNTNLCRKGKICYPCLRKPLSGIHFLCVCPLMCLASCMAQGVCSSGRRGWGRGQSLSPGVSPPLPSPLLKPQEDVSFPADASAEMPILFLRANLWALPIWGSLCFALIIMPQPVTLMGKGQAPRQTGGEISQHPLPALGILSHLENAKKNKKRKWTKWSLTITLLRDISVNTSELIPLLHIKWYYCMCYYIWP